MPQCRAQLLPDACQRQHAQIVFTDTTCPSGVQYGRLLDIGRAVVDERVERTAADQALRWTLRRGLMAKPLFGGGGCCGALPHHLNATDEARALAVSERPDVAAMESFP